MGFPLHRPRRTRQSDAWRRMVRETRLTLDSLIYPLFVVPGRAVKNPISSMPGIAQLSVDEAVKEARAVAAAGIPAVMGFRGYSPPTTCLPPSAAALSTRFAATTF